MKFETDTKKDVVVKEIGEFFEFHFELSWKRFHAKKLKKLAEELKPGYTIFLIELSETVGRIERLETPAGTSEVPLLWEVDFTGAEITNLETLKQALDFINTNVKKLFY